VRLIAPFGFYGAGNIGDEATLHGFARLVRSRPSSLSVWVGSCDPRHDARVEPAFRYYQAGRKSLRRRWATAVAEAVVFPGGTPIMDGLGSWPLDEVAPIVSEARQAGRAVAFVGVGTETLDRTESRVRFRDHLAPHVRHWSVRSAHDADRLASWGVTAERITIAADMAWLIEPVSAELGRTILEALDVDPDAYLIGINVNNEAIMRQREPRLFESLAAFADGLVEDRDATVVFFCSEIRTGPECRSGTFVRRRFAICWKASSTIAREWSRSSIAAPRIARSRAGRTRPRSTRWSVCRRRASSRA
jgi:polysaccharide pyruvyl transferase WcaK-like protein